MTDSIAEPEAWGVRAVIARLGNVRLRLRINVVALVALIAILAVLSDRTFSADNVANVLRQIAVVVIVGCPFTLLMVAGGIDLSVGGVLAVSGLVSVLLVNEGVPIIAASMVAVLLGALIGLLNGIMVAGVGINTVIASLGTLYVTRGATQVIGGGKTVAASNPDYTFLGNGSVGPVPVMIVVMAAVLLMSIIVERRTILGRNAVLIGSNARGARLSGVPVRTTQALLFVATGAAAGLAGVIVSSRFMAGTTSAGTGFEFDVLIATLLGGTSLLGGEGTVAGLLLGALIAGSATSGLNILGVPSFVQTVLLGLVLLGAVGLDAFIRSDRAQSVRRFVRKEPQP